MRYPPLAAPQTTVEQMVLNVDVAPTLLELAGVDWHSSFDGRSFVPLFDDPERTWRDSFLFEYFVEKVTPRCPTYFAVRTSDWKYIHYPDLTGMDELYHLSRDPREQENCIEDAACQTALSTMRAELLRLNRESGNPFPMSIE